MPDNNFQKETPIGKELLIWFLIATGLALVNWFLNYRPVPEVPASGFRFLVLQLALSYFVFAHILILIVVFRMTLWDRIKSAHRFIQEGSGLLFAFIGFLLGLYNMKWFAGLVYSMFFPGQLLTFQPGDSLLFWLGTFGVIAVIGIFAVSYYTMRLNLKESYHIHLERERLKSELATAREMQMGIMPSHAPELQGCDVAGICLPATEIGGDYFDYIRVNEEDIQLAIAVADVSGKGMKAAMMAVMVSGMLHAEVSNQSDPAGVLTRINGPLFRKSDPRMFTAMLFGILDPQKSQFSYTNAGQMPPLLLRDERVTALKVQNSRLPLGVTTGVTYGRETIQLKAGDHMLLYTDGINEARNGERSLFGDERLKKAFRASAAEPSAEAALVMLQKEIRSFTGDEPQNDDITMVLIRVA